MWWPPSLARSAPWLLALASVAFPVRAPAQPPLHQRIDQAIEAATPQFARHAAGPAADAEFLRRVTLDLTGTIPTAAAARAFLADAEPQKRARLVDRLLASPEHARHLAHVFDVLLMERRPDKYVPHALWHEYLRSSFARNKPWDELVREILSADGADPKTRPAAKFALERGAEPNVLTRDVSRLFLGTNLQCAQCHDHPRIEEYRQAHYYGLFAFLSRTSLVTNKKLKLAVLSEKADGDVTYQSVFDPKKATHRTGPRIPGGPALSEPAPVKGKEYRTPPVKGMRAVPTYSRRARLGPELTRADNRAFARNLANRLWALLMGRGIVHPPDMDHPANPPSHPELLDLLTAEVAARKFDLRALLRELALSRAYARSSEAPEGAPPAPGRYTVALLKPLSPEQLAHSLMQATGLTDAERQALGARASEAALYARLAGHLTPFARTFGSPAGTPEGFDPRVDQALFLANGALVRGWLAPRPGNLTDRLSHLATADQVAEELYLSILTRRPDATERREVADLLKAQAGTDRVAVLQELAWALLASAEFRFNH